MSHLFYLVWCDSRPIAAMYDQFLCLIINIQGCWGDLQLLKRNCRKVGNSNHTQFSTVDDSTKAISILWRWSLPQTCSIQYTVVRLIRTINVRCVVCFESCFSIDVNASEGLKMVAGCYAKMTWLIASYNDLFCNWHYYHMPVKVTAEIKTLISVIRVKVYLHFDLRLTETRKKDKKKQSRYGHVLCSENFVISYAPKKNHLQCNKIKMWNHGSLQSIIHYLVTVA